MASPNDIDREPFLAWLDALVKRLEATPVVYPLDPAIVEAVYARAYAALEASQWAHAWKLFVMLLGQRPTEPRMLVGFAHAFKGLGMPQYAAVPYGLAAYIDPEHPAPMLGFAQCLIAMHEAEAARAMLSNLVSGCEGRDDLAALAAQAQALRDIMERDAAQHA